MPRYVIATRIVAAASLLVMAYSGFSYLSEPGGSRPPQAAAMLPPPIDNEPGERDQDGQNFREWRQRWFDSMLRAAPGDDPRALDAAFRNERMARHQAERAAKQAAGADLDALKSFQSPAVSGVWRERGSSNQSGRTTGYVRDTVNDRGVVLAHGGNVWLGGAAGFTSVNDSATFAGAGLIDRVVRNGRDRLLLPSAGDVSGMFFSDDWGASYRTATGLSTINVWFVGDLAVRDPANPDVYMLRAEYDWTVREWRARLWNSTDAGESFADLGFVGNLNHSALFSPRHGSSEAYLLTGTQLRRIAPGTQELVPVGTLPIESVAAEDKLQLTGGVTAAGQTFIFVLHSRKAESDTQVWRSLDGGATFERRGIAPTRHFSDESAESSTRDPNILLVGGVNLYRSFDGGSSFQLVNEWYQYYASPADKLHADIMDVDILRDASGAEITWISTDGGTYRSTDYAMTVVNQSLTSGLNVGQYYASYTRRSPPHTLMAGSQDQGYQRAVDPPTSGVLAMQQVISGDYGSLTSSDGGGTVWMVYPGFVMVDVGNGLPMWQFRDNGLTGTSFIAPLAATPGQPNRALLAGGRMTGTSGHQLIELTLTNGTFTHVADSFIFPDEIGAVSYGASASIRYVLDVAGKFWVSQNGGAFTPTTPAGAAVTSFRGTDILLDPARPGRIYVSGSGYSNPGVFVSDDGGQIFLPMAAGLPNTLITRLAISGNGRHLFASARTGAFYFDRTTQRWIDLISAGAPNQQYTDVDYIDALGVARFSTYGRGIWDFEVRGAATGAQNEPALQQISLPTPNPADANCPAGFFIAMVDDGPGPGISSGAFGMELLLDAPGTRVLAGGLNFGGLLDVSQGGFAAVNIANPGNENQRLMVSMTGNPSSNPSGALPARLLIERRNGGSSIEVFQADITLSGSQPFETSIEVPPGFYVASVVPRGFPATAARGAPEGRFMFSLTTQFVDRPGGGFQGGAVVGGYHASNPFGGTSGFAAFCLATPHSASARVLSAPTYGSTGARDLRLSVLDQGRREIAAFPATD